MDLVFLSRTHSHHGQTFDRVMGIIVENGPGILSVRDVDLRGNRLVRSEFDHRCQRNAGIGIWFDLRLSDEFRGGGRQKGKREEEDAEQERHHLEIR